MAGSLSRTKGLAHTGKLCLATTTTTKRCLSSKTESRHASYSSEHLSPPATKFPIPQPIPSTSTMAKSSPLSILPLSAIIRSIAVMSVSSSKTLLRPSLAIMTLLAHTKSPILSPDSNPLLRLFLKHTFYKQFCAGENAEEVKRTVDGLKGIGFKGVILCFAKEVVLDAKAKANLAATGEGEAAKAAIRNEVTPWAKGTLETVRMTCPGDFVAIKFTGAGSQALYALLQQAAPPPALKEAIDAVCDLAAAKGVRLLFDAENVAVQPGIDAWTLDYMKKYNTPSRAIVYGTYQAYLKSAPAVLASHLAIARKSNFALGVKLVRGAYIGSDPRHLIHDTKEDTDACYDGLSESLVHRTYTAALPAEEGETVYPVVEVVLAGHNQESMRKTQQQRAQQAERGEKRIELVYAQLQGMADDVSCELVAASKGKVDMEGRVDVPRAYKYLVWGSTGECMKYLLRRAQENKDAVQRTREGRDAMAGELWRRMVGLVR